MMARLRSIGRALTTPFALWTAALLVVGLLVWFVAPLISIGEVRPVAPLTVRLSILVLLILLWAIVSLVMQRRRTAKDQSLLLALRRQDDEVAAAKSEMEQRAATELKEIKQHINRKLAPLRRARLWRRFWFGSRSLPRFLLIGPPGAGKTSALLNAALTLPFPVTAEAGVPTRGCDAIVTDRAVFLDLAGRYTLQHAEPDFEAAVWTGLLDWLRKWRSRQPLNGVLLVVSAADMAVMQPEERQALAQTVRHRLDEINERLHASIPVYVLFSKMDCVFGFAETFELLSAAEAAQVWGIPITPPRTGKTASPTTRLVVGLADLVRTLLNRQLDRLEDEPDEHNRALIFNFPSQMAAMEGALRQFFDVIGGTHQFGPPPPLRGIAFASARQGDRTIDLLAAAMQPTFRAPDLPQTANHTDRFPRTRPFFLRDLFNTHLVAQAGAAGATRPPLLSAKARRIGYATLLSAIFCGTLLLFVFGYRDSGIYLTHVVAATNEAKVRLNSFRTSNRELPPFRQTLSILDALRKPSTYSTGLSTGRVFQVSEIQSHADAAYRRGLHNLLLPYILRSLDATIADPGTAAADRFRGLKLYLMLGGKHDLDPILLKTWTPLFVRKLLGPNASQEARLRLQRHLAALGDSPPPPSKLDAVGIAKARRLIEHDTLAKIAYDLVRDDIAARNLPRWRPGDHMGSVGARALALASGASIWDGVPALYTRHSYLHTLPPIARRIADEVAADAWVIGPSSGTPLQQPSRIRSGIFDLYRADYIRTWDSLLSNLSVVKSQTPAQAASVLAILIGSPSPLKQILDAIAAQTNVGRSENLGYFGAVAGTNAALPGAAALPRDPIADHFAPLRKALRAPAGKESQIDGALKVVEAYYRQLNQIAANADAVRLLGKPPSILDQANDLISQLPSSVQPVFTRIRMEVSSVIDRHWRSRLKAIWSSSVLPFCQAQTSRNFPFDPDASQDITIADFGRLFGPNGEIAKFRKKYLAPFIDTSERPWRWRSGLGTDIGLNDDALTQFEHANAITTAFFSGDKPLIQFTMEFSSLDRRALTAQFDAGGPVAQFAHGPAIPVAAQWPPASKSSSVTLSMTPEIAGQTNSLVGLGSWGLFRVMQKATVTITGPVTTAHFRLGNRRATLLLRSSSAGTPFDPQLLSSFRCPVF